MTAHERLYALQLVQLEHDEKYHKDVVIMPLAERVKHMALHNAKYTGYFIEALDASDGERMGRILTDAFIIALATANTLNQDLSAEIGNKDIGDSLSAIGSLLTVKSQGARQDEFGFVKAFAREAGTLAKVCESWDHLEDLPFRDMMRKSNLGLLKLVLAEATTRQLDLEGLYRTRLQAIEERSVFNRAFRCNFNRE